jgi:riboflavin synthase
MFTGIVESVGTVVELRPTSDGYRMRLETSLAVELMPGDSLAVNGVCLTMVASDDTAVQADIGPETARVTTLSGLGVGVPVNLERPMRLDGRLGGHLVLGHVDAVGTIINLSAEAESHWLTVGFPVDLAPYFIHKGSVAVDGVSLTVARLNDDWTARDRVGTALGCFEVQVVPFTWNHTTFRHLRPGDRVNLECDMVGKYVVRALDVAKRRG